MRKLRTPSDFECGERTLQSSWAKRPPTTIQPNNQDVQRCPIWEAKAELHPCCGLLILIINIDWFVILVKWPSIQTLMIMASWQSINQSNFYSANIPGKARLSGATANQCSNSKIEETGPLCAVYWYSFAVIKSFWEIWCWWIIFDLHISVSSWISTTHMPVRKRFMLKWSNLYWCQQSLFMSRLGPQAPQRLPTFRGVCSVYFMPK